MASSSKGLSGARIRSSSFEALLDTLEDSAEARSPFCRANPLANVSAPLGGHSDPAACGRWDLLYEYREEASMPNTPSPPAPLPRASVEAIAGELNLDSARTASELLKLRRDFMWRNHPDRCPEIPRDLANARVAVANMLIDLALRKVEAGSRGRY